MPRTKLYTFDRFREEYSDDAACLDKIMKVRYGERPVCPGCKRETKFHRLTNRRAYTCQFCGHHIYPCVGTPFEKSTTPLHKWFHAMYLFTASRHGVPAKELERQLGVTYKCAWRIAHQIRRYMADMDRPALGGSVEADETYVGGRARGGKRGRGSPSQTPVFGMKERNGDVSTQVVADTKRATIEPIISKKVLKGATVNTDEWWAYTKLDRKGYRHLSVRHNAKQWVKGTCHTNSIEGHWSHLKRSILGTHIHVSKKHLSKYLAEFDYRHNMRKRPEAMFSRLLSQACPSPSS